MVGKRNLLGDSMSEEVVEEVVEEVPQDEPIPGIGTLVFGKWDASEIACDDPGLAPYINITTIGTPHTGGRHANLWFGKSKLSLIERFVNSLMRTGQFSGKKQNCVKSLEEALDHIHAKTGGNPLDVLVAAIVNSAPCEETTRIRFGAVSQPKAVDVSPSRRLDIALRHLANGCTSATRKSKRSLTQGIINEIKKASEYDVSSFAVSKREEMERIAASSR